MTQDPSLKRRMVVAAPALRTMTRLTMARVIAVHPEQYTVDVATMRGSIHRNVQVLSPNAGSRNGHAYLPRVTNPAGSTQVIDNPADGGVQMTVSSPAADRGAGERTAYAVLAFLGGSMHNPVCLGFIYPNDTEMLFAEAGLEIDRHESDIWDMRDAAGNYEHHFPDGSFIRVGTGTTEKPLAGANIDSGTKPFAPKTSDPAKTIFVHHKSGTEFTILPSGKVILTEVDDKDETIAGDSTLAVTGASTETHDGKHTENFKAVPVAVERNVGTLAIPSSQVETVFGTVTKVISGLFSLTVQAFTLVITGGGTSTATGTGTIHATLGELDIATSTGLRLGSLTATEKAILGDAFKAYFDTHTHAGGGGGVPTVPMPSSTLASQAKVF